MYALAERRLVHGQLRAYLAALQGINDHLAAIQARGAYQVYVAIDDADRVFSIGYWRSADDLIRASESLPAHLRDALRRPVAEGEGSWQWYESTAAPEVLRGRFIVASLIRNERSVAQSALPSTHVADQETASATEIAHVLVATDDPAEQVLIVFGSDENGFVAMREAHARAELAGSVERRREFAGRLVYEWGRYRGGQT